MGRRRGRRKKKKKKAKNFLLVRNRQEINNLFGNVDKISVSVLAEMVQKEDFLPVFLISAGTKYYLSCVSYRFLQKMWLARDNILCSKQLREIPKLSDSSLT